MSCVDPLNRLTVDRVIWSRDFPDYHPALEFVTSCGIACEQALVSAAINERDGREAWQQYDLDRAERLAMAAEFVASGGRHG